MTLAYWRRLNEQRPWEFVAKEGRSTDLFSGSVALVLLSTRVLDDRELGKLYNATCEIFGLSRASLFPKSQALLLALALALVAIGGKL